MGIDFVGPISPTADDSSRHILTLSDYCTNWVPSSDKSVVLWLLHLSRDACGVSLATQQVLSDPMQFKFL